MVFSLSALCWRRIRGLWSFLKGETDWGGNWVLGLVLMGRAMLSKSLVQFSVDGGAVFPPRYLPGAVYDRGNENNDDLLQKIPCMYCYTQCPQPYSRPPLTHTSAGDSWTLTGKTRSVSGGVTAPFSWVLVHKPLFVPSKGLFSSPV